jgi:cell division protein FtsN
MISSPLLSHFAGSIGGEWACPSGGGRFPVVNPATVPPDATQAAAETPRYALQAGSYPDPKAADEAKAKLALSGFVAHIQPVTINGKTWHRVRVGPYATASELEVAKRSLADNGIKAIALKETGP